MSASGSERASSGARTPAKAGLELLAVCGVTALALALFPATHAGTIGPAGRVIAPARLFALVVIATWFLWRSGGSWRGLGLRRPKSLVLTSLLVIGGFVAGELIANAVTAALIPLLHAPPPRPPRFLAAVQGNLAEYLYWLIPITWGSAAFGEEMLFRGFIFDRLDKLFAGRAVWAVVPLQALLFGVGHVYLGVAGAVAAGVLGLVLGCVYLIGGRNLWPVIVIHGLVDTTSITALFLGVIRPS